MASPASRPTIIVRDTINGSTIMKLWSEFGSVVLRISRYT